MILMLSQFSQTSLVAIRDLNLNKTLSNSNFNNDESINGNTIIQNLGELYCAGNIFDSNCEDDFIIDKKPQITNGVIFSKICSSKDKYLPHGKTEDNFKAKGDSANENKSHQSKEAFRKKSKNKRNILRDPNDKRSGLKKINSDAYTNDSKKRGSIKKSLDSRINGQNMLQISNKKMFNQKNDCDNIIIMNDSKSNPVERAPTQQMPKRRSTNMRNNQFENCISDNANSKVNYSDMYSNYNFSKPITSNDKRVVRKRTTRPLKNRKFK